MDGWRCANLWRKRGSGFCVEVSHHTVDHYDRHRGSNRWCVYAYIYQQHPLFANFEGDGLFQDAALTLPLHGGPTLLRWHHDNEGNRTSIQVGADYDHMDDEFYTYLCVEDDARSVFNDAEKLVSYLDARNHDNES